MVSRRKILSNSRDDLNMDYVTEDEEDVWYQKDKLYKDHVQEVLEKWNQIDDEIWAKVICFEKNRRVAKAYARAPVLTINGSDEGFDGYRIGLLGFDNPLRDGKTEEAKKHIGHGVKIKMDDAGNILIKRVSRANVYLKDAVGADESNSFSTEALKLANGALEPDKPVKLFDMKKFQQNVSRELKRSYPDRRKLEIQCISVVAFVRSDSDLLDCPCWVMIVNIVAMDMLKSKLPPVGRVFAHEGGGRSRLDEDPYSVPGSGSSGAPRERRGAGSDQPPKLPPRDTAMSKFPTPKPDYDEVMNESKFRIPHLQSSRKKTSNYMDDPYYCGMKAHTPNFASRGGGGGSKVTALPSNAPSSSNSSSFPSEPIYVKNWRAAGSGPKSPTNGSAPPLPMHPPPHLHPGYSQHQAKHKGYAAPEPIYSSKAQLGVNRYGKEAAAGAKMTTSNDPNHIYSRIYGRISLPRFVNPFKTRRYPQWE